MHGAVGAEGDFEGCEPGMVGAGCCSWRRRRGSIIRGMMITGVGLLRAGAFVSMLSRNIPLDGLVKASQGGPPSEESECHVSGFATRIGGFVKPDEQSRKVECMVEKLVWRMVCLGEVGVMF